MPSIDALLARTWVRTHTGLTDFVSKRICHGVYDGDRLGAFREASGDVDVLLAIPPMSDVNGALPHPGVRILQTIARHEGFRCEVMNYNLPVKNPHAPFAHLSRVVRELNVRVLGVSTYSQAIRNTLEGLARMKREFPDLVIVLGGPHPTESYLSLMGVSFIDYVIRGEAEESFPALLRTLFDGRRPEAAAIPGVYWYDAGTKKVEGVTAPFIDIAKFDGAKLLRYHFSPDEVKQYRMYRGCHGTAGAEYWPVALVRGCPYDCTFCAAYQMSGKRLRYRRARDVVDDLEFYQSSYGRSHFSFIDDSFTQHYDYIVELCEEILRRTLKVYWTTDNGIRYETLGSGKVLESFLQKQHIENVDDLIALMIRAGWRGTAVGIESGAMRVRKELVRKGGAQLDNDKIIDNLRNLKRIAKKQGVYFYVNGFLMAGFPELPLPNGKTVPQETLEEMQQTWTFANQLRDSGAVDMMNLSMVIPLPGTDMWESLNIRQKMQVLTSSVPQDHPGRTAVESIQRRVLDEYPDLEATRYNEAPEASFWRAVYELPDPLQIIIMQSYDDFNADAAHKIGLKRPPPEELWHLREEIVEDFYGSARMKLRMLKHVVRRSGSLQDIAAYLTLMGRKYEPKEKEDRKPLGGLVS